MFFLAVSMPSMFKSSTYSSAANLSPVKLEHYRETQEAGPQTLCSNRSTKHFL